MRDHLINLAECQPENLVWVSGWYDAAHREPTGWHLYQFGMPRHKTIWWDDFPDAQPVCRAPSFKRTRHSLWAYDGFVKDREQDMSFERPGQFWCHRCIIEIVERLPHIFTRRAHGT